MKVFLILVITAAAVAAAVLLRKKIGWRVLPAALALALAGLACVLCVLLPARLAGAEAEAEETPPPAAVEAEEETAEGDPVKTVDAFFSALLSGNFSAACDCLSDYRSLGLETPPEAADASALYDALLGTYAWEKTGGCEKAGKTASQKVRFTHLDIPALEADLRPAVLALLEEKVAALPADEVYDAEKNYLPEFVEAVYAEALSGLLQNVPDYLIDEDLLITLKYDGSDWLIVTNRALLSAVSGGTA